MIGYMTIEDLDQVILIEEDSFTRPWTRQYFMKEIDNGDFGDIFVLKENGEVIAYGDLWYMFENCDLTKIVVKRQYRHKGYGKKMLRYLIRAAKEKGCEFMHLEVDVNNADAIRLYEKNRFTTVRTRNSYYHSGNRI